MRPTVATALILIIGIQSACAKGPVATTQTPYFPLLYSSNNQRVFSATADTKWVHITELIQLLVAINDKLRDIEEKQKPDSTTKDTKNDVQIINHRLQNVEDQIARSESFNKMRLEQLLENSMKSEFLIDQLNRRNEKNQQQLNNRLTEIESSVETLHKQQENIEKMVKHVNTIQNELMLKNEKETPKFDDSQSVTKSKKTETEELQKHLLQSLLNVTVGKEINELINRVHLTMDRINGTNGTVKCNQIEVNHDESTKTVLTEFENNFQDSTRSIIKTVNGTYGQIQSKLQEISTEIDECISITNKVHQIVDTNNRPDMNEYLENFVESIVRDVSFATDKKLNQFENKLKTHLEKIDEEQQVFKTNCHRLQLNEEHLEDKLVNVLENLFNYVDNKTQDVKSHLDDLSDHEQNRDLNYMQQFQNISSLMSTEKESLKRSMSESVVKITDIQKNSKNLENILQQLQRSTVGVQTQLQDLQQEIRSLTNPNYEVNMSNDSAGITSVSPNRSSTKPK